MGPAPILILSALGVTGLVLAATGKAGAATGAPPGPKPKGSDSAQASGKTPSIQQEADDMPLSLKKDMAKVIQDLTVVPDTVATASDGTVTAATIVGPVTKEAVQNATALSADLGRQGFPIASKTIADLAKMASKRIPDPPKDAQIPLPLQCFTPGEQTLVTRAAELERDPAKLQAIIDALTAKLKTAPPGCSQQISDAVSMITAILHQAEAKAAEDAALKKTQEILNAPSGASSAPQTPTVSVPTTPNTSPNVRVVVVNKGEGLANITKRLLGSDSRWRELRNANVPNDADGRKRSTDTDKNGGIKPFLQPGQKLFVPASWPAMPSITVPVNVAPPPPVAAPPGVVPQAPAAGGSPAVVVVHPGEGLSQIAVRLLGQSQGLARWKELRARNVPVDANGKTHKVDSSGNIGQQPGDRLFVPESWPIAPGTVVGYAPSETPSDMVSPKSDREIAAFGMCEHLLRCQAKNPETLGAGRFDKKKVLRFRHQAKMSIAPNVTPDVLVRAAECGVSTLPLVMHWPPDSDRESLVRYKAALIALARQAAEDGDLDRSNALIESAKREMGQAAGLTPEDSATA